MLQHGAQVLQVQQQQAVGVGDLEDDLQHPGLRVVQVQHAREQQRTHVRDRGAHRVPLFAEHVPQRGRAGERLGRGQATLLHRRGQLALEFARLADARQVALDVRQEHRDAEAAEAFRQFLQGDRLAGAGCTRDETMPVGQPREQEGLCLAVLGDQHRFGHGSEK